MKLHFEPNLVFQHDAIEAVCDLFQGQEICNTEFTVTQEALDQQALDLPDAGLGIGNRLTLLDDELASNLAAVQIRNGLPPSPSLDTGDFTVEMETGTGKTYVYLRTIYELNRRYGFSKFVIVVPSVAIKEGVYKTLQITDEHLKGLYAGTLAEYFPYDSAKLGQVRNFATSTNIQIMVVTVGAINKKDVNNLYKDSEKTGGEKPIDLIRATRPIVIVDEPQSVDGGLQGAGRKALTAMNPLCTLRYSATHVDKHHMVYRLDAVDAYEQKLVKQIEVASATVEGAHNAPYVRVVSLDTKKGDVSARVELDVQAAGGVKRQTKVVRHGDDLEQTTGRDVYADCLIGEINTTKPGGFMELSVPGDSRFLGVGAAWGDVDADAVHRQMIRRTIKEHFDKELRLRARGVKVLSLFFIDVVAKYREYGAAGDPQKGLYAQMFEEEFESVAKQPTYKELFEGKDPAAEAADAHEGYFSIDKKGGWTDTSESNQTSRDAAERAYNLIMKDKERLLSFSTPLRFIFSHSALREGWDNPNVFQICTLRDMGTERERRQTIGRGLRLCVNQDGERLHGFEVNTLTVIATEGYEAFAEALQKEIEEDTGIRFGVVERHQFVAVAVVDTNGTTAPLGVDASDAIWQHLKTAGYVDAKGRVQDALRQALKDGTLDVPDAYLEQAPEITAILRKLAGRLDVKNADERRVVGTRQSVLTSPEFKALWDRIKSKTTYRVNFDNEALITSCIDELKDAPAIPKARLQWRTADIAIGEAGVEATETGGAGTIVLDPGNLPLPDLLTDLQDRTQLTRRSILRIVLESDRLKEFRQNPQAYIQLAADVINRRKQFALVDGIKYQRIGEDAYYAQQLFESEELTGYVKNMLTGTEKSPYAAVIYDSDVEKTFATDLENNTAVKLYTKLPGWFKVPTPLGSYNPDWAILVQDDDQERVYFVVETKGKLLEIREGEKAKIACGRRHFDALAEGESPARYLAAESLADVLSQA